MKNYFLSLALIFVCQPWAILAQNPQWRFLGDTLLSSWGTYNVLTALHEGVPHLVFSEYDAMGNDHWKIQRWDGTAWQPLDTSGLGNERYQVLDFTGNGTPQMAYFQGETRRFGIKRLQNGIWSTVSESPVFSEALNYIDMAFEDEKLWVAFSDFDQGGKAFIWHFDGANWIQLGQGAVSSGNIYPLNLQVENGTPWVAFREIQMGYAGFVKKFNGASWETVGAQAFDGNVHGQMDFVVTNNVPYITHIDSSTQNHVRVLKFNGAAWETVGSSMITPASYFVTLAVDRDNNQPYVLFDDSGPDFWGLSVMRFNGNTWEFVGDRAFIDNYWSVTLIIDGGIPHLGYQGGPFGQPASFQVFSKTSSAPQPPKNFPFFNIQPNPVVGKSIQFNVKLDHFGPLQARIIDSKGQCVKATSFTITPGEEIHQLPLPDLSNGIYFLQISSASGNYFTSRKFLLLHGQD
jgi:hypothetical protein